MRLMAALIVAYWFVVFSSVAPNAVPLDRELHADSFDPISQPLSSARSARSFHLGACGTVSATGLGSDALLAAPWLLLAALANNLPKLREPGQAALTFFTILTAAGIWRALDTRGIVFRSRTRLIQRVIQNVPISILNGPVFAATATKPKNRNWSLGILLRPMGG